MAQVESGPSLSVEAATDERRRGVSWSDGDAVVRATLSVPVADGLTLGATAVSLRGSRRHSGADGVIDVQAGYARQLGDWRLSADATYHLFPGASGQGYVELGTGAGFLIGPAGIDLFARYAPRQRAIGGDNLYLGAAPSVGIPGTPLTVSAHIGHSSGAVRDFRALRLRPDGDYWDHGLAVDYRKGKWFAGLSYANTDIARNAADHAGATLVARAGVEF
jgi:uncharacterized protein (TIGR02001 family)